MPTGLIMDPIGALIPTFEENPITQIVDNLKNIHRDKDDKDDDEDLENLGKIRNKKPEEHPFLDWRTEGKVTPIKSQGLCGSCYSFSGNAALESRLLI